MKIKRLITLLLTLAMLTSCLFPLAGCKQKQPDPENPFEFTEPSPSNKDENDPAQSEKNDPNSNNQNSSDPDNSGGISLDRFFGRSDYDASAPHGEKKLYRGYISNPDMWESVNDTVIYWDRNNVRTLDLNDPNEKGYLCFDPLCEHMFVESCTSWLQSYRVLSDPDNFDSESIYYPAFMLVDRYDRKDVPVIYMSFRRHRTYFINDVMHERESVYCIERFDMSTGKRTVVADNIEETIDSITTYGDYIYFTATDADDYSSLCRVGKAGGSIERLGESQRVTYEILDVVDDKLYYLVDERYLNRCDLTLASGEELLDLADLQGYNRKAAGVYRGVYSGYLYYISDIETVYDNNYLVNGKPWKMGEKANMYRLSLNHPTATPEMVVEGMTAYDSRFTDDTLFYLPAVNAETDLSDDLQSGLQPVQLSDGTIRALDLNTLEETTVCEATGLWIFFQQSINCEDDCITFTARPTSATDNEWETMANDSYNTLIGRKSGGVEIWRKQK